MLAAAGLFVAAVFSGVVLWLTLTAEDTMLALRAQADRAALTLDVALSRPPDSAGDDAGPAPDADTATPPADVEDVPSGQDQASAEPEPDPAASRPDAEAPPEPGNDGPETAPEADGRPDDPGDDPAVDVAAETEPEPTAGTDDPPVGAPEETGSVLAEAPSFEEIGAPDPEAGLDDTPTQVGFAGVLPAGLPVTVAGPDPALMDLTEAGPLPRIGDDGQQPRQAYARPFDAPERLPRVAIVVTQLGLLESETNTAIATLPSAVSLAFSPYSEGLDDWLAAARAEGHEALIMLPMEPSGFPLNDPGPNTLLSHLPAEENRVRLEWALSRTAGYPGVTNLMGAELSERPDVVRMLLQWLNERGLFYLDSQAVPRPAVADVALEVGIPYVANDRTLDIVPEPVAIDRALASLEALALERGYAVGVASAFPVSVTRIERWARDLEERGLVLAPVSAIANHGVDG